MSFVIYDVETTGLDRHFDQIIQFAAIRTDNSLNKVDTFNAQCRLLPHVIPAPRALATNGMSIDDIIDRRRQSHYSMISEIQEVLGIWSPAVFLGFNSIKFDEEFVRHAFYQCLYRPYLTNVRPNARADVLSLARAFAAFHPEMLKIPQTEEGRQTFSLRAIATSNGFPTFAAHDARADVEATLHVCRLVANSAPELWSRFLRFAQRAAATDFLIEEAALLLFETTARQASYCVTQLGANRAPAKAHVHYCLNLRADTDALARLTPPDLERVLESDQEVVRKIHVNASPMLCPLYEAPAHLLNERSEDEWIDRGHRVRQNVEFVARLLGLCETREIAYPESRYVEQQLYEKSFWPDSDNTLALEFHAAAWEERLDISKRFTDKRLRQLARRLVFVERPDLMSENERREFEQAVRNRLLGKRHENPPWMTVDKARAEFDVLANEVTRPGEITLGGYLSYLNDIAGSANDLDIEPVLTGK